MHQINKKDITAKLSQPIIKFRSNNYIINLADNETLMKDGTIGKISAKDLTAGSWNGTFNFNIKLNGTKYNTSIKNTKYKIIKS